MHRYASDGVKRLDLTSVHREPANNLVHQCAEIHAYQKDRQNDEDSPQCLAYLRALPRGHDGDALPVGIRQLFVRVDAFVVGRQGSLVERNLLGLLEQCAVFEIYRRLRIRRRYLFGFLGMMGELRCG